MKKFKEQLPKFLFAALITLSAILIEYSLKSFISIESLLFILLIAISLCAWTAGLEAGLVSTAAVCLLTLPLFPTIIPFCLFVIASLIINFIIEKNKRPNQIKDYELKEKQHLLKIDQQNQDLEEAKLQIKARDEFLSLASHELRTPLTSMLLQLQTALHSIRNVSLAHFSVENLMNMLENAEKQTQRVSKMINDLLNVSLITTGRLDLEVEKVDLTSITKEVIESFSEKLKKEERSLKLEAGDTIIGEWDKARIQQVITNLITNAIKYGDNSPIEVRVKKQNSHAQLEVQDHGIGIALDQQKKIFARFERVDSSKNIQGLGIGLYITNQIINAHGGSIKVNSKPGQGSLFIVELPIKEPPH